MLSWIARGWLLKQHPNYLQVQLIKRDPIGDSVQDASLLARTASPSNVWELSVIAERLLAPPAQKASVFRELIRTQRKARNDPARGEVPRGPASEKWPLYELPADLEFLLEVDSTKPIPVDSLAFSRVHRAVELEAQGSDSRPVFVLQTVVRLREKTGGDTRVRMGF